MRSNRIHLNTLKHSGHEVALLSVRSYSAGGLYDVTQQSAGSAVTQTKQKVPVLGFFIFIFLH